jgi:hypothetical protein
MSCGTPIITSKAGALAEIGGDAATYVDPREVSSIRDALAAFENGGAHLAELRARPAPRGTILMVPMRPRNPGGVRPMPGRMTGPAPARTPWLTS